MNAYAALGVLWLACQLALGIAIGLTLRKLDSAPTKGE